MGFWKRLAKGPSVEQCADTYALTAQAKYDGIVEAIQKRQNSDPFLIVAAHFESTFVDVQTALDDRLIDYHIVDKPITPVQIESIVTDSVSTTVLLSLADFMVVDDDPLHESMSRDQTSLRAGSIVMCERHPMPQYDRNILTFAKELPYRMRLGYFLSLQDSAIHPFLGEWTETVMRQLGLKDHELITSHLIWRRIELGFRKRETRVKTDLDAHSPEEWLRLNDQRNG